MRNIDAEAFSFVQKIAHPVLENHQLDNTDIPAEGMIGAGTEEIANLGEVQDFVFYQVDPISDLPINYFATVNEEKWGLNQKEHVEFSELIEFIMNTDSFAGRSDFKFLLEQGCKWLLNTFQRGYAAQGLGAYLLDRISEETKLYRFSFKMDALQIEEQFEIGNTRFFIFTRNNVKEYYDEMRTKHPNSQKEDTLEMMVGEFAAVTYRSTYDHAKQLALRDAELSVDVLKSFCLLHSIYKQYALPELEHRRIGIRKLNYWSDYLENPFDPTMHYKVVFGEYADADYQTFFAAGGASRIEDDLGLYQEEAF
jgi:hypothetical protein